MHIYIGIVRTYRNSYGLSTIPYVLNTITNQYSGVIITPPRYLLRGPVTFQLLVLFSHNLVLVLFLYFVSDILCICRFEITVNSDLNYLRTYELINGSSVLIILFSEYLKS